MWDWADALTPVRSERSHTIKNIFNTASLTFTKPKRLKIQPNSIPLALPAPSLSTLLQTLRLVALGKSYEVAAELSHLSGQHATILQRTFQTSEVRQRFINPKTGQWYRVTNEIAPLCEQLNTAAWQRILEHAQKIGDAAIPPKSLSLPNAEHATQMIGMNRHLLMNDSPHGNLIKFIIDTFNIPLTQFSVVASSGAQGIDTLVASHGFQLSKNSTRIDAFPIAQRDSINLRQTSYAALLLNRNSSDIIRDRYELAVVFLAIAALTEISRSTDNSQH